MKWKEIQKNFKFKDNSIVTQTHQTHLYDCYEIEYEGKKIILSKDHIIKINISNLPDEAKLEVKEFCNSKIPLKEDIQIEILGYIPDEYKTILLDYVKGDISIENLPFTIEEISEDHFESYILTLDNGISREIFVKRFPTEFEDQKINEEEYWIPVEGLAYLFNKYGELDI